MLKIYLDTCCYNRPYDDHSVMRNSLEAQAKAHIQTLIIEGRYLLATSYVLLYENSKNPYPMRKMNIDNFLRKYSSIFIGLEHADKIYPLVAQIVRSGVKTEDAFHIACALYAECDYFLSVDNRVLKYKTNSMCLINPLEFFKMEAE